MNAYDRAARALLGVRTDIDKGRTGDHRTAALGALLELWASGASELWVRVAVAELWRGRMNTGELRAHVDDCMQRAHAMFIEDAAPRRTTTILPPASGNEIVEEKKAARDTLESYNLDNAVPAESARYSTVPAGADWWTMPTVAP